MTTSRLLLRRPREADIEAILAVHRHPDACRHNPSDALATRAEAEELRARPGTTAVTAAIAVTAVAAVTEWAVTVVPGLPLVARIRPDSLPSQRVARRAGLRRAPHLGGPGCDGFDWICVGGAGAV